MKLFKPKASCVKFYCDLEGVGDFIGCLNNHLFFEDPHAATNAGFVSLNDPWKAGAFIDESCHLQDWNVFVFRVDTKKVNPLVLEKELKFKLDRIKNETGEELSKAAIKELSVSISQKLLAETKAIPNFIPVIYSEEKKHGYILSTSNKILELFWSFFREATGAFPYPCGIHHYHDSLESVEWNEGKFLTWLWWRIETNPHKPIVIQKEEYEPFMGGSVTVRNDEELVSTKSDNMEESRIALLRGLFVDKCALGFNRGNGEKPIEFTLNNGPSVSGLPISVPSSKDLAGDVFDYATAIEDIDLAYGLVEGLVREFISDCERGDPLPPQALKVWSKGDFCTRNAPEF